MSNKKKNPITNFIWYARRYGFSKAYEDWKKNFLLLDTPEQLLKKEIIGYIGTMGALLLALIILAFRGLWYIGLIMLFSLWIAYVQFKGKLRQLQQWREIGKEEKEIMDLMKEDEE